MKGTPDIYNDFVQRRFGFANEAQKLGISTTDQARKTISMLCPHYNKNILLFFYSSNSNQN